MKVRSPLGPDLIIMGRVWSDKDTDKSWGESGDTGQRMIEMELPGKSKKTQKICECSDGYEDGLWENGGKKKWEKENEKKTHIFKFYPLALQAQLYCS